MKYRKLPHQNSARIDAVNMPVVCCSGITPTSRSGGTWFDPRTGHDLFTGYFLFALCKIWPPDKSEIGYRIHAGDYARRYQRRDPHFIVKCSEAVMSRAIRIECKIVYWRYSQFPGAHQALIEAVIATLPTNCRCNAME
jgi:hypothetical protein